MSDKVNEYLPRPIRIEAIKWTGENVKAVLDFLSWRNVEHDERFAGLSDKDRYRK